MSTSELLFYWCYVLPGLVALIVNAGYVYARIREELHERRVAEFFHPRLTYGDLVGWLLIGPGLPIVNIIVACVMLHDTLDKTVIPRRVKK